jgi:hypothetical protein
VKLCGHLGEKGKPAAWCGVKVPSEAGVSRTAVCARRRTAPHRLLRVLAAVLLLVRAIQPVSHVVGSGSHHHAGHDHLLRQAAADTHHSEQHPKRDLDHQGCHFCRFNDIALPPPAVAVFVRPAAPSTVSWPETAQQIAPARHFLVSLQPRAPPRPA